MAKMKKFNTVYRRHPCKISRREHESAFQKKWEEKELAVKSMIEETTQKIFSMKGLELQSYDRGCLQECVQRLQ